MSWYTQAKIFFKEVGETKKREEDEEEQKVSKDDLEFVSSASEARLLEAPTGASFLIFISFILLFVLLAWSIIMPVDEVVKAQGKVIPSKQVQVIQNLEGGIIKEIKVLEGQSVEKGQELILISNVSAVSDLSDNVKQYNMLLARLVALNAHIKGKILLRFPDELKTYPDIIARTRERFNTETSQSIAKIKELEFVKTQRLKDLESAKSDFKIAKDDYDLAKEELALNEKAFKEEIIPKVQYIKSKHEANGAKAKYTKAKHDVPKTEAAHNEATQKRKSFIHETINSYEKEKSEVKSKLNTMQSKGVSLQAKVSHSKVVSPVVGTVKKINFNTVGGVIRPGMDIMEIIPTDDKLIIEVKVKPKDIGFILVGLKAKVKLTAFDFSTYGGLEGEVIFVSADTITDKKGVSFFLVRVKTKTNYITDKKGIEHTIIPGMQAETDIVVDNKSIFAYILKPMLK
jgi:adhesin transport system membrane fusion protein